MRYPAKFVFVAVLCLPLLAAAGCRCLLATQRSPRPGPDRTLQAVALFLGAAMGGIVLYAWAFPFGDENWPMTWRSALTRALLLGVAVLVLQALRRAAIPRRLRAMTLALCLVHGADVLSHYPRQTPTIDRAVYAPNRIPPTLIPPPRLGTARAMISTDADAFFKYLITAHPANDYALSRQALFSNCNLLDGIPKVDGFYALYPRRHDRLLRFLAERSTNAPAGLLDFLGVSQVTAPTNRFAWSNRPGALPWITSGQQPRFLADDAAFAALTDPGFDPRKEVLLPMEARPAAAGAAAEPAVLLETVWETHRVRVRMRNQQPTLLVLAQSQSRWWRARLDGTPVPLWPANYAFQAVLAPAGEHTLQLNYEDWPFRIGWVLAALGAGACVLVWRRRQDQQQGPNHPELTPAVQ